MPSSRAIRCPGGVIRRGRSTDASNHWFPGSITCANQYHGSRRPPCSITLAGCHFGQRDAIPLSDSQGCESKARVSIRVQSTHPSLVVLEGQQDSCSEGVGASRLVAHQQVDDGSLSRTFCSQPTTSQATRTDNCKFLTEPTSLLPGYYCSGREQRPLPPPVLHITTNPFTALQVSGELLHTPTLPLTGPSSKALCSSFLLCEGLLFPFVPA